MKLTGQLFVLFVAIVLALLALQAEPITATLGWILSAFMGIAFLYSFRKQ